MTELLETEAEPSLRLWLSVHELYAEYADLLDSGRLDEWIGLFREDAHYLVTSRENEDAGHPLALMRCEGHPGLQDRVRAITETMVYTPRVIRHLVSGIRMAGSTGGRLRVTANFAVLQSVAEEPSTLFAAGRYQDVVHHDGGRLRFAEKKAIYDGALIMNAMVYPL